MKGCYGIYCSILCVDQNRLSILLRVKYGVRLLAEVRIFPYTTALRPRLWPTYSLSQWIEEDLSPLAKSLTDHVPPTSSTEVRVRVAVLPLLKFLFHGATAPSGPGPAQYRGFTITVI
jgi:hypothetical protein